jgi:hypothetical protein
MSSLASSFIEATAPAKGIFSVIATLPSFLQESADSDNAIV